MRLACAAGLALALAAAPATAACPAWRACRDGWLWETLLPGMIVAGLALWVGGPFLVAAVRWVARTRQAGESAAEAPRR